MVITVANGKQTVAVCFGPMPAGMRQVVTIQGQREKKGITYFVDLLPSDFGTAVRFDKVFEAGTEDRPESYDVLLGGGNYFCECKGFLRHGHCKHGIAARQMIDAGALRPSPRPEQAVEIPAKAARPAPWCDRCNDAPGVYCEQCSI